MMPHKLNSCLTADHKNFSTLFDDRYRIYGVNKSIFVQYMTDSLQYQLLNQLKLHLESATA